MQTTTGTNAAATVDGQTKMVREKEDRLLNWIQKLGFPTVFTLLILYGGWKILGPAVERMTIAHAQFLDEQTKVNRENGVTLARLSETIIKVQASLELQLEEQRATRRAAESNGKALEALLRQKGT